MMYVYIVVFDDYSSTTYNVAASSIASAIHIACELSEANGNWFSDENVKSVTRDVKVAGVER